jgi:transcriptional regulator with GAF, ATPase, and Fis domain
VRLSLRPRRYLLRRPTGCTRHPAEPTCAYLDEVERDVLVRALERYRYNRTAAAASLGLSLRQMRYRMARLGVHVGGDGDPVVDRSRR